MTPLLEVVGLRAGYGDFPVLRGIDLSVAAGAIVAVIGSNGAGKTTMMRALAGTIGADGARLALGGHDIFRTSTHERVEMGMALVPEGRLVFPDLDVDETLRVGAFSRRARAGWRNRAERQYNRFPQLRERRHARAGSLSGGEQQMLALARGLMSRPELLLLDEPSLGLAPGMASQLFDMLRQIREDGMTILLVEQNVQRTLELADYAYVLENGTIALEGAARELSHSPQVRERYLGL